jgi:hypothetical protein
VQVKWVHFVPGCGTRQERKTTRLCERNGSQPQRAFGSTRTNEVAHQNAKPQQSWKDCRTSLRDHGSRRDHLLKW